MVTRNDLSWTELSAQLPAGSITFAGDDITISVKAVTGDVFTGLTDEGVTELMYKLRLAAGNAQATVNAALDPAADDLLAAFPVFEFGAPTAQGRVPVSQITRVVLELNAATVKGVSQ